MSWWEAGLLGLVQGLTEFLPISSSGHLVIGQYLLGLDTETAGVTFEVFVHFGTVLSIVTVYRQRILSILRETFDAVTSPSQLSSYYAESEEFRFSLFILITLIPTGIAYVLFRERLEAAFDSPRLACGMLLVTGLLLLLTLLRRNPNGALSPLKSLMIGIAQAAAMVPGISRSGSTICTALYQNVENKKAADFSFLMLLPVVIGATLIKGLEIAEQGFTAATLPLAIGTFVAYVSGVFAINAMIDLVSRGNLHYFAYYCFLVGAVGLIFI